ncbi:MAG: branched-chain amino acid transport protein AzlD [Oscillospiraceae bacterium]|jgi:branched-subunit amino acid transport protein AzlD|nr:branched-chain amino acid transport protein AzlD [Oscillospiraceae bacterium]
MQPYTTSQALITILIIAGITFFTRAVPFFLFGKKEIPPAIVIYLGKVLPPAVIALLVVYCLKNVSVFEYPYGLPQLISIIVVVILHVWKRNNLVSIFGGTVLYMILVQYVF